MKTGASLFGRGVWRTIAFAVGSVFVATAVRLILLGVLGTRVTYLLYYPAVIAAALYGGFGAGILATVLSILTADYYFVAPTGVIGFKHPADVIAAAVFGFSGVAVSWLAHAKRRAEVEAAARDAEARSAGERLRAVEELAAVAEKARLLADIIEKSEQPLGTGYPDGSMGQCNRAFCELTGYTEEELRAIDWVKTLTPPEWQETERAALAELDRTGKPVRYCKEYVRKDGTRVPIELLVHAVRDDAGKAKYYYSFLTDITERLRVERELVRQREWLRVTLSSIGDAVLAVDAEGRITFFNQVAEQLTGWTGGEASGRPVQEILRIVDERTGETGDDAVARVLREGKTVLLANHSALVARDGSTISIEDSAAPIRDSEGALAGAVLVFHDVTGKRRAQEALERSEAQLQAVFENIAEGLLVAEPDGRIRMWNRAALELHGLPSQDEFLVHFPELRETFEVVAPDGTPVAVEEWPLGRILRGEELRNFEVRVRRIEGDWERVFSCNGSIVRDAQGAPELALLTLSDVTEKRADEEKLRRSEAVYRAIARNIPDGSVGVVDTNLRYVAVDGKLLPLFGVEPGELEGRPVNEGRGGEEAIKAEERYRRALSGESIDYEMNVDGRIISGRTVPLHSEAGAIVGAMSMWFDITERKRSEEQLRQSQKLESIGLLAGGIAHDFNNLLTGIMGNASLIMDEAPPETADRIGDILTGAEKAAHLTRQLLAYSGKGQFTVKPVHLSRAVRETVGLLRLTIPKSVELRVDLRDQLPLIHIDPGQLQQVVMNLIINAGEAIGEAVHGRVAITDGIEDVERPFIDALGEQVGPGRYVYLEVEDTGPGIAPEIRPRMFDPFYTTKQIGRGLGLAAVAGIVRSQKGALRLETTPGRGAAFRVLFPAVRTGHDERSREPQRVAGTVLIVDDEEAVRRFMAAALRKRDYRVLEACDGVEALAILEKPDSGVEVMVLDVLMPVMGGHELLEELAARRLETRVLLTSGYNESEARRLCISGAEFHFIQKPFAAAALTQAVGELIKA
jgi:two-component system, cell cycle sensor histidine kinase and response regulator CckA